MRTPDQPTPQVPDDAVTFPGGARMPLLGFGTWQIEGEAARAATAVALEAGYRHVDTAAIYDNEAEVGRALAESGLARDEVFVTTKCPPTYAGRELDTLRRSLDLLGTDHVDLWLIHWPGDDGVWVRMWERFLEAREAGLARDVGVSNFDLGLLDEVTSASGVAPVVNQVKWSPLLHDAAVLRGHRERGVALEGYSGLRGGTLEHPAIARVAEELGRTTAQVIVRWHLQHGIVAIPKSRHADRIRANADVAGFELTDAQMAVLDGLGRTV